MPTMDETTPDLDRTVSRIVERYVNQTLHGAFRIGLYNSDGQLLAGGNGCDDPFHASDLPLDQIQLVHPDEPAPPHGWPAPSWSGPVMLLPRATDSSVFARLPVLQDAVVAGSRLSIPEVPVIRWLLMYAPAHWLAPDVLAACTLTAELLSHEFSQLANVSRLRHTVREQEIIINHISDGLLVMDRDGILKYCNAPASQILKISVNASTGRPIKDVLDFDLALGQVFDREEGYIDRELQIESPTLSLHLIDTAVPIRDDNGKMVSVVNTFRKIERVKQLSYRMTMDRQHYQFSDIQGQSATLQAAVNAAKKAAQSTASVVLYGESGTGKELFAQAIHADGVHADGPFIALNCAALPRDLVESELFGYTAGSFTGADRAGRPGKFELASGGTLFLDEIADMPLDVQVKLLRVLQERRVVRIGAAKSIAIDVRVIAASNQKLADRVDQGAFREDLYYRLNVIEISIPSLRERHGDIPLLLDLFVQKYGADSDRGPFRLSSAAVRQLENYHWPGNIRELENVVERLAHLRDEDEIERIPAGWLSKASDMQDDDIKAPVPETVRSLAQWEEEGIRAALVATDYNVTRAAQGLGISRQTLYAKMKRYGIGLTVTLD